MEKVEKEAPGTARRGFILPILWMLPVLGFLVGWIPYGPRFIRSHIPICSGFFHVLGDEQAHAGAVVHVACTRGAVRAVVSSPNPHIHG